MKLHKVAEKKDLPPGAAICAEIEGKRIAVFNVDGTYYAVDDACPHAEGSLAEGYVDGHEVECPLHGALFSLTDGSVLGPPAEEGVRSYPVQVDGEDILIRLEA